MEAVRFLALLANFLFIGFANSQEPQRLSQEQERAVRARYPQQWEISIPAGTRLDSLKRVYDRRLHVVPARDLEDQSPFPLWFRAYLRETFPDLPASGPYQFPRVAAQILEWMVAHPDLRVSPEIGLETGSQEFEPSRVVIVGTNINITNLNEKNAESAVAVHNQNPQFLIAAANNLSGSGRQRQFRSSNGGTTWNKTLLPLAAGTAFHSDPTVAWTTDGTAWTATLGINSLGTSIKVQVFKSTDRGATWSFVNTVSTGNNNDKEMMWIDTQNASPHKNKIYVAWDVPGNGMRFARSTNLGVSWSAVSTLSTDQAIGCHLTTGPAGELYVAWPDVTSRELRIRKSTNGGASFGPRRVIARTNDSYEVSIPAFCQRKVLIYLAIGVDRSTGPRQGRVYATWTDRNGTAADPGCGGITAASNSNIYFSRSTDGGNTWSTPRIIHSNPGRTDQFNPWMDVDPTDGTIHVVYYNTKDDAGRRKTHNYYIRSRNGGDTWIEETRVTTAQTDETAAGADPFQYGDYNGLAVYNKVAYPVWTDRRAGVPGSKEQVFTTKVTPTP